MATGPMVKPRIFAQAVRLLDGRVLVAGGRNLDDAQGRMSLSSAEIFDPATNTWSAAAELSQARYAFVLVLLPDGQALAIGGARDQDNAWNVNSFVREIESYDPVADRWRISGELPEPGVYSTVSLLVDGRMWVAGGHAGYSRETYWSDTWLIALR
jgi:N-acetylneuraminic acid mutarotase